jgi:hypothetical protein
MRAKRLLATTALTVVALLGTAGVTGISTAASAAVKAAPAAASDTVPKPGGLIVGKGTSQSTTVPTISENWSGYVATAKKQFSYVHSSWVVPAITCTGVADQYTSNWVGLDGYSDATVEQDGTAAWCGGTGHTTPKYQAWYEMYPANSVNVFNVHPGDIVDASVTYAGGEFSLKVSDLSTGKTATDVATCASCERSSAEWIIERPGLCNNAGTSCILAELADFGTTTMTGDQAQVTGGSIKGAGAFTNTPIIMIDPLSDGGFISIDNVSALSGKSFTVTWLRSGSIQPLS